MYRAYYTINGQRFLLNAYDDFTDALKAKIVLLSIKREYFKFDEFAIVNDEGFILEYFVYDRKKCSFKVEN